MDELFPVVSGIIIGLACSMRDASLFRRSSWVVLCIACGIAATILSGEFKISWAFLLIDIPLVIGSAVAVVFIGRHLRRRAINN